MAQFKEITAIYTAAVIQGLALVTFPAASTVFTSAADYGLSSTEYGGMFVPQAVTAIGSSLLGASLTRRLGGKRIYLLGLVANLLAMALLVLSRFVILEHTLAYGVLLVATGCLGAGRVHGAGAQYIRRSVLSAKGRQSSVRAKRAAWVGDRAGAGFCGAVCWSGDLVGAARAGWDADSGVVVLQCGSGFD